MPTATPVFAHWRPRSARLIDKHQIDRDARFIGGCERWFHDRNIWWLSSFTPRSVRLGANRKRIGKTSGRLSASVGLTQAMNLSARSFCDMVAKMGSRESINSSGNRQTLASDLRLPVFEEPQVEPWPIKMSWSQAMLHLARTRGQRQREFDSAQRRFDEKNPAPFVLP